MPVPEYPPDVVGGGGAVYSAIAEHLIKCGHAVTVICGDFSSGGSIPRLDTVAGVRIVRLPTLPPPPRMPWLLTAMPPHPRAWNTFLKYVARYPWDVAHVHGAGFPLIDVAAWFLRRRGIPYTFTCHSIPIAPFEGGLLPALAVGTYLRCATLPTIRGAEVVTAVSNATCANSRFPLPKRTTIIYNGLRDRDYSQIARSFEPGRQLRVVSAGRITRAKGFDIVIRAIAMLRQRYSIELHYDIWGEDGGDQASFVTLAEQLGVSDLVSFRGSYSPERRALVFRDYDVLVVPSRVEPFGLVALEGMALGLPVLAANRDGLSEVFGSCPGLVPGDDPEAIAAELARFMNDPKALAHSATAARERAEAFRWSASLDAYEQCLQEAASATGSRTRGRALGS